MPEVGLISDMGCCVSEVCGGAGSVSDKGNGCAFLLWGVVPMIMPTRRLNA